MACGRAQSGAEVYPVHGEVFFNGEPAAGAWVHFHPVDKDECSPAFALVQEDGSFELSTHGTNDGAEAGDYVVTLSWRDEVKFDDENETNYGPDRFGERYSKPNKSELKATVGGGENDVLRFDLKE
jgi:hypothetical protein